MSKQNKRDKQIVKLIQFLTELTFFYLTGKIENSHVNIKI